MIGSIVLYGLGVYALMRDILDNGESVPRSLGYALVWPLIAVLGIVTQVKDKWNSRKTKR